MTGTVAGAAWASIITRAGCVSRVLLWCLALEHAVMLTLLCCLVLAVAVVVVPPGPVSCLLQLLNTGNASLTGFNMSVPASCSELTTLAPGSAASCSVSAHNITYADFATWDEHAAPVHVSVVVTAAAVETSGGVTATGTASAYLELTATPSVNLASGTPVVASFAGMMCPLIIICFSLLLWGGGRGRAVQGLYI